MTSHARTEWQEPHAPVTGPAINWDLIAYIVIHYPGGPVRKPYDTAARLRGEQAMYLLDPKRGYSLGYSWMVDEAGDTWEVRGWTLRNAANDGDKLKPPNQNALTVSIQIIVNNGEQANAAQINGVRELVAEARRRAGRPIPIRPHHYSDATQCPGAGIDAQLTAGEFEPRIYTPRPQPKEDPMKVWRHPSYHNAFGTNGGGWIHLSPKLAEAFLEDGAELVEEAHEQTLKSAMAGAGITAADLVPK